MKDGHGRIVGTSKVARDISDQKRTEAERAELHRRLTSLVDASASLLHSPDTSSVLAAVMRGAQELLVADAYTLWMSDAERGGWRVVESSGVSPAFATRIVASYQGARFDPCHPSRARWPSPMSASTHCWRSGFRRMATKAFGRCSSARCTWDLSAAQR